MQLLSLTLWFLKNFVFLKNFWETKTNKAEKLDSNFDQESLFLFIWMWDLKTKKQIFKRNWIHWDLENVTHYIFYIAEQMCRFTRAEFLQGCRALKADNIKSVQQRLPEAAAEALARSDLFKDLYRYTFRFGLASTSCATRYS